MVLGLRETGSNHVRLPGRRNGVLMCSQCEHAPPQFLATSAGLTEKRRVFHWVRDQVRRIAPNRPKSARLEG